MLDDPALNNLNNNPEPYTVDDPGFQAYLKSAGYKATGISSNQQYKELYKNWLYDQLNVDNVMDIQKALTASGSQISPDQQQYINNLINQFNYNKSVADQVDVAKNSLKWTYEAAQDLGLNPSAAVMSLGGVSSGIGSEMAKSDNSNIAQERSINEFNQKAQMARTVLSLVGGLAGAGIYGGSLALAKNSAAKISAAAARQGEDVVHSFYNKKGQLISYQKINKNYY